MNHRQIKAFITLLAASAGLLGLATTSASAKTVWLSASHDKTIQTAPKSIRGTWYGYQSIYDKHPSKLVVNKKSFTVTTSNHQKHTLKFAKSWKTAYEVQNLPNVDLRKSSYGWTYFAVILKHNWDLSNSQFYYGQVLPVKYGKQRALAYVQGVSESKTKVPLLTKKKINHPVFKSTKHMTVINYYGGK